MSSTTIPTVGYDQHHDESRQAQRQADRWLITGTLLMGSMFIGFVGLPFFLRGVWLQRRAQKAGLSVRPIIVTLIGYLVILDAALNSIGWSLDLLANRLQHPAQRLAAQTDRLNSLQHRLRGALAESGARGRRTRAQAVGGLSRGRVRRPRRTPTMSRPMPDSVSQSGQAPRSRNA